MLNEEIISQNKRNKRQYLSFDIALLILKFRSALTCLGGTDAVVLQSNFVQRTCSRSLYTVTVSDDARTRTLHITGLALTDRLPCHTAKRRRHHLLVQKCNGG